VLLSGCVVQVGALLDCDVVVVVVAVVGVVIAVAGRVLVVDAVGPQHRSVETVAETRVMRSLLPEQATVRA
jgi:hypothetical protein